MDATGFRVSVGDDPDCEDLTAEVYYQEKLFAVITQEESLDEALIRIYDESGPIEFSQNVIWELKLEGLRSCLDYAMQRLWDLRRRQ